MAFVISIDCFLFKKGLLMSSPIEPEDFQDDDEYEVLEVPSDVFQELVDIAREDSSSDTSLFRPPLREPPAWEWRSWSLLNRLRR